MLQLSADTAILVATQPQDFRKGIDGFVALCQGPLQQNPRADIRFVFINRNRTMIRVLAYDGTGFWLMTKRLSKGRFQGWPCSEPVIEPIAATRLRTLLSGLKHPAENKIKNNGTYAEIADQISQTRRAG